LIGSAPTFGGVRPAVVVALVTALEDSDARVRSSAAYALGSMGGEAKEAVPALLTALGGSDAKVREVVANALSRIGAEPQ
jgi:HEAT repeat protein